MALYQVTLKDGQSFQMEANLVQAAHPIWACFHPDEEDGGCQPPFQTADASHDETRAAELVAEYFATDEDDCTEVASVDLITGE